MDWHLVGSCWQLRAPSGRVVTCAIYMDGAPGFELRVRFSEVARREQRNVSSGLNVKARGGA